MLQTLALALLAAIAAFAIYVATLPSTFTVAREALIAAPPEAVFAAVNDFRKWQAWSPWAKLDPNAKGTFSGKDEGVGSSFAWDGNRAVGAGRMTITESKPHERIVLRLEFTKPMVATNTTVFTFKPERGGTHVTWAMSGESNFIGRAMCVFMDMDKMVGGKFEQGLANMDATLRPPAV